MLEEVIYAILGSAALRTCEIDSGIED
jgi:hypothetical protein